MKWNTNDLPAFVTVADLGGISAAARHLGTPKSSVSRVISRLEDDIGLQLFVRGTRALRLTPDGAQFYRHARRILEQVEAATAELAGLRETPRGDLTVALPMAFSREIVAPHLDGFQALYPDIRLEIRIGSSQPDLLRDQIDLAVIVGSAPDSDLMQQRLIESPLIWIASPEIAAKLPDSFQADQIGKMIAVAETRYADGTIKVATPQGGMAQVRLDPARLMRVNDPLVVRDMVASGSGLSLAPTIYCEAALANGALIHMYPDIHIIQESSLSLLFPSHRLLPLKARVFIDFLKEICRFRPRVTGRR
jgi:DNA-binding transcriptional LysR family regulator